MLGPDDAFPTTRRCTSTAERRVRAGLQKMQDGKPEGISDQNCKRQTYWTNQDKLHKKQQATKRRNKIIHSQKKSMEECETMGRILFTKCTIEGGRSKLLCQNKSMNCNEKSHQQTERRCNIFCGHCQRTRNTSSESSSDMERSVGRSPKRVQRTEQSTIREATNKVESSRFCMWASVGSVVQTLKSGAL